MGQFRDGKTLILARSCVFGKMQLAFGNLAKNGGTVKFGVRAVIRDGFRRKPKRNWDLQKSNFIAGISHIGGLDKTKINDSDQTFYSERPNHYM